MTRVAAGLQLNVENRFDVAVITGDFDFLVSTDKFVIRMDVVIKERFFPFCAGMASVTLVAAMLVMRVIFEVARYAGHIHFVVERTVGVTISAGGLCMFAFKGEVRIARVIETRVMPIGRIMAGLTLLSAAAVMRVVGFVTAETGTRRVRECSIRVTIEACSFLVLAKQREFRGVVVKFGVCPFGRFMTGRAIIAHGFFVRFVVAVAIDAL